MTATNGSAPRPLAPWMPCATSSLPEPVSASSITGSSLRAMRCANVNAVRIVWSSVNSAANGSGGVPVAVRAVAAWRRSPRCGTCSSTRAPRLCSSHSRSIAGSSGIVGTSTARGT